jgi:hypothetical protein
MTASPSQTLHNPHDQDNHYYCADYSVAEHRCLRQRKLLGSPYFLSRLDSNRDGDGYLSTSRHIRVSCAFASSWTIPKKFPCTPALPRDDPGGGRLGRDEMGPFQSSMSGSSLVCAGNSCSGEHGVEFEEHEMPDKSVGPPLILISKPTSNNGFETHIHPGDEVCDAAVTVGS